MTDMHNDQIDESTESERRIQAIIKSAGARPKPDPFRKNADKARLRQVWTEEVRNNRRLKLWKMSVPVGLAAAVLLAVSLGLPQLGGMDESLGEILLTQGEVTHTSVEVDNQSNFLRTGDLLASKSNSSATIRLKDETIVQLAPHTQITLRDASDVWLHKGKIFVDSPGIESHVTIRSSWGEIRDVGTQFEVSLSEDSLELAMREGIAEIRLEGNVHTPIVARSSEREADLVLVESGNKITRTSLKRTAQRWDWTRSGAPDYPGGEYDLASIVKWAARQTGRDISYGSSLAVLQLKNERVVWPPVQVQGLEAQLTELSETTAFNLVFSDEDIEVSIKR
ncbi:MAG: FecR family protein [Pseudomonadales bacterium]